MNFLDESGLKKLWSKIKASFGTAIVSSYKYSGRRDDSGRIRIPFVANHQIVEMNMPSNINVYDWFKDAPEGGILEIVFAGAQGGYTYCSNNGKNYMGKMASSSSGPHLTAIEVLKTDYNTYTRLIKTDDNNLIVAEFVVNK